MITIINNTTEQELRNILVDFMAYLRAEWGNRNETKPFTEFELESDMHNAFEKLLNEKYLELWGIEKSFEHFFNGTNLDLLSARKLTYIMDMFVEKLEQCDNDIVVTKKSTDASNHFYFAIFNK